MQQKENRFTDVNIQPIQPISEQHLNNIPIIYKQYKKISKQYTNNIKNTNIKKYPNNIKKYSKNIKKSQ
jgi:hypothetical protein